jgi:Reverse transcriptase (RNA-dependent DNA polymerase)
MLIQNSLPKFLWPEAITYVVYLKNRSPTRALKAQITPYEAFWDKKPNISQLQEFGINCWVLQQGEKPSKLEAKSRPYQFVRMSEDSRAWRYFVPHSRKVLTSRNITFEIKNPDDYVPIEPNDALQLEGEQENNNELEKHQSAEETAEEGGDEPENPSNIIPPSQTPSKSTKQSNNPPPRREMPARAGKDKSYEQFRLLRTQDNLSPSRPDAWKHHVPSDKDRAFVSLEKEPQSLKEAESLPAAGEWHKAMESELKLLKELETYTLTDLPEGRKAIGSKWVFRIKKDDKGNTTRRKARLVAQGFSQIPGMDFEINNTSSPIVRMETNRLLLALAARYNLEIKMVDVKGAYLNGKLTEEIYMKQPEGYSDGTAHVFKLHKTIYGLRQSGKVWNERLDKQFQK